ncbi:MAG: hypothetical protein H7X97_10125 [Opitutaceae bacterium]|nr:hypothetical protein [Verrucomicrobiales bacterium]
MNSNNAILVPPSGTADNGTNALLDIRPPVEIPNGWAWLAWAVVTVSLIALAVWAWRRWLSRVATPPPAPLVPAHIRARQRLDAALRFIADPKAFCIEVSAVIRIYLEERFRFHAPDRTTEEFLLEIQSTDLLAADQKQSLRDFLEQCDLVKFARYEPTETELRGLMASAHRLVDETQPVAPSQEMSMDGAKQP